MLEHLREIARSCFDAGLDAADPYRAVTLALSGQEMRQSGRLIYVALGKAADPMMRAALDWRTPDDAILVTNPENEASLTGVTCLVGDHPTPSERGEIAASQVEQLLVGAQEGDLILLLLSGGASALVPAPKAPLTLADKVFLNDQMLGSGMQIEEVNIVRRALSRLKGGGFLTTALPAHVETLILSDVPSDDPRFIASGPTVPRTSQEDAEAILKKYGLFERLAQRVRDVVAEPVTTSDPNARIRIVGSNANSVRKMLEAAPKGFELTHVSAPIVGDVEEVARGFATHARSASKLPALLLSGGEPTVVLKSDGKGGRNQELALRVAVLLKDFDRDWVFLSAGTDGRDGPTDAAGAIVDKATVARAQNAGLNVGAELANNNAYDVLKASGDLLITGGTGTNVGDLHVLLLDGN